MAARSDGRELLKAAQRAGTQRMAQAHRLLTRARPTGPTGSGPTLSAREAVAENGFTVFRGAFSAAECAALAVKFKAEAGIVEGTKFTSIDAINRIPSTREVLFDPRVLGGVRSALGEEVRFLQVSDLHYRHDTFDWHRDSVHRAHDSSEAPDWAETEEPYGVVKAILYLESENAAMGIMPGSHASPFEMDRGQVKKIERRGGQLIVGADDDPNRRVTDAQRRGPMACRFEVGDLLVFDERMYHAGRRVERGVVSMDQAAPKLTLSMVFGLDNVHSERMYSYFRYARDELKFRDFDADLVRRLDDERLVLRSRWSNFYERRPSDLRFAYLRDPAQLEPLMARFARAGTQD